MRNGGDNVPVREISYNVKQQYKSIYQSWSMSKFKLGETLDEPVILSAITTAEEKQDIKTRSIGMTVRKLTVRINHLGDIIEIVTLPDVLSVMQAIEKQHKIPISLQRLFICTEEMRNNGAAIIEGEELLHDSEDADLETLETMCHLLEINPPIIYIVLSLK